MKTFILSALCLTFMFAHPLEARKRRRGPKVVMPANQILKLEGTANLNGQPTTEFVGVKNGDEIETGEKSVAVIRVTGLGLFRLKEKTKLKLKQIGDRNNSVLELASGNALILYRRLGNHTFKTPHGKMMIKEKTSFFASADPTKPEDAICLCHGGLETFGVDTIAKHEGKSKAPASQAEGAVEPQSFSAEPQHKLILLTEKAALEGKQSELTGHSDKLIEDMDALYALP